MSETAPPSLLSVITVTYNSANFVAPCLRSAMAAAAAAGLALELIVIDNASADNTVQIVRDQIPQCRVVENAENVGFAKANNQAFRLATGDVWLLLNPDAILQADTLVPLLDFLATRPRVAAVAPTLVGSRTTGPESGGMTPGIRSMAGHFLLLNRLLPGDRGGPWRGVSLQRRPRVGPRRVDWLAGAVMLLRPDAIREVEGFDPAFFLFGEDIELGERLCRANWELWIVPAGRANHLIGGSSEGMMQTRWVEASHEFYAARATAMGAVAVDLLLILGLGVRAILWKVAGRSEGHRTHAALLMASTRRAWELTVEDISRALVRRRHPGVR